MHSLVTADRRELEALVEKGKRPPGVQEALRSYTEARNVLRRMRRAVPRSVARRGFASNRSQ